MDDTVTRTTNEVAELLGITPGRVRQLAAGRKVGRKFGRDWLFTNDDVEALKERQTKPGSGKQKRPQVET